MPSNNNLSHGELQKILQHLDQAIYNHQQWYNNLIRIFICKLPEDKNDIAEDSHKKCHFGQWYYGQVPSSLRNNLNFIAIDESHRNLHNQTRKLLLDLKAGKPIHSLEFDNFANSLEKLRLEIFTLKNEFETLLYIHDPLTMAVNRVNMLTMLREQHSNSSRNQQPCCIAMLDLDYFKKINDEYGHAAGDKVLESTSHHILKHLRPYDTLFRYGGEEFLLCLPQTNIKKSLEITERLRTGIAEIDHCLNDNKRIHVTTSIGISLLDPSIPVEESIDRADRAMYAAKSCGRNNTVAWSTQLQKAPVPG